MKIFFIGIAVLSLLCFSLVGCASKVDKAAESELARDKFMAQVKQERLAQEERAKKEAAEETQPVNMGAVLAPPKPLSTDGPGGMEGTLDLTALSTTMVYSEVYHMVTKPLDYIGRNVKMKGQFNVYQNARTDEYYYSVIIADATACCQQGLEFVLRGEHKYPEDYPKQGTEIIVTGTFEVAKKEGYQYGRLKDAQMEIANP